MGLVVVVITYLDIDTSFVMDRKEMKNKLLKLQVMRFIRFLKNAFTIEPFPKETNEMKWYIRKSE